MPSTDPTSSPVGVPTPHRRDAHGDCLEDCPAHAGDPIVVGFSPELVPLLGEWLEALGLELEHVPTPPDLEQHYGCVVRPGSPAAALLQPSVMEGRIRPARTPRNGRQKRR